MKKILIVLLLVVGAMITIFAVNTTNIEGLEELSEKGFKKRDLQK